jgi:GT2 family glycosyltransferase
MNLSVIIVNWNSAKDVRNCLTSIFAGTCHIEFEVIVVDSASYDGCADMVAKEFPQVVFVQSDQNVGFGRANNLGCEIARGSCFLFLNPDTEVRGDAITAMAQTISDIRDSGCLGCRLLNSDGSLQTSCIQTFPTILNQVFNSDCLRRWFPKAKIWGMKPLFESISKPTSVEAISGACIMIRREVFKSIGGFSADYFMYAEDMDLCYKAFKAGHRNYFLPTASVIHHGDSSVGKARSNFAVVMATDSLSRYFRKFHGDWYAWAYKTIITEMAFIRLFLLIPSRLRFSLASGKSPTRASWNKWCAVLRWGFGLERWTASYQQSTQ